MEPKEFLDTAITLTNPEFASEECDWRTAISRAYYAAFLDARKLLGEMGFGVKNAEAHTTVQQHLQFASDELDTVAEKLTVKVHTQLRNMHSYRLIADYQLSTKEGISLSKARQRIEDAYTFIDSLQDIRNDPELFKSVKDKIKLYRSNSPRKV